MDKINRILCRACPALTAAALAGCAGYALMCAIGLRVAWTAAYLPALIVSAALAACGGPWAALISALDAAAVAAIAIVRRGDIGQLFRELFASGSASGAAEAGTILCVLLSMLLGMLMTLLLRGRVGVPLALIILTAALIAALTGKQSVSIWSFLPGLIAGVAAFACDENGSASPRIVLPAVLLAIFALLLVPNEGATWKPLEDLAARVRDIAADYTHYTEERFEFSINEKGYNHAAMLGDRAVVMLGGAVQADDSYVMRVDADADMLLRGTVKNTYTGYSWEDDRSRSRYLYFNPARISARSAAFDSAVDASDAGFTSAGATVTMLAEGTSTLFVPTHMTDFSMNLENAVYYNTAGEIFLTRSVAVGDTYSVTAVVPTGDIALVRAAEAAEQGSDDRYDAVCEEYLSLPEGIDARIYQIADEIARDETSAAAKAFAIENYLAETYTYALDAGAPEADQDFVSWFMLTEKKGYCSYFASAMAVMCRMEGIPARYVEGYRAAKGDTALTGEDAHAWVEVYLRGIGWTAFDPTARAQENQGGDSAESGSDEAIFRDAQGDVPDVDQDADSGAEPTPSPTPEAGDADSEGADTPTPSPEPDGADGDTPEPSPEPEENDAAPDAQDMPREDERDSRNAPSWLRRVLLMLALLALIALAVWLVLRRLRATDPMRMIEDVRDPQTAALTIYRGLLTLLSFAGQSPTRGETPDQFAARIGDMMHSDDYVRFVSALAKDRYSGAGTVRATVELGKKAYRALYAQLRRREKLKYNIHRVLRGIGSIERI